jgi:hypothetical protein
MFLYILIQNSLKLLVHGIKTFEHKMQLGFISFNTVDAKWTKFVQDFVKTLNGLYCLWLYCTKQIVFEAPNFDNILIIYQVSYQKEFFTAI